MLKKLVSLTIAVMMVMALIAVPAMAAGEKAVFSSDNVKRNYYNLSGTAGGSTLAYEEWKEISVPAVEHVNAGTGTRDSHAKMIWKSASDNSYHSVKYIRANSTAGYVEGTSAPRYVHQRVKFVWYDGTKSKNNRLYFALNANTDPARAKIFGITGKDHSDVYCLNDGSASTNRRMVWNAGTPVLVTGSGESEKINTMDLIINVNDNESNHKGMVYVFFNGELFVYGKPSTAPTAFYGWSITQEGGDVGDYLRIWQDETLPGHTEYYDANGYVPTFEDVLNDAGLTDAVEEDSNIMMKTSDMRWFMPHGNDKVRIDAAVASTSATNWLNNDGTMNTVVYNGTQATVSRTPSDSASWEKAADLLAGVYPQTSHGIGYSSYHPRYKYVRFSFDQTMSEGTQLAYRLNNFESLTGLQFRDNGGKLVAVVGDTTVTTDANTTDKNRIDWVIEPIEDETNGHSANLYLFVNEKFVAEGTLTGENAVVRLYNIALYTKGSTPSVVYDDWSMTLYNTNQTYDALYEEITGEAPSTEPTFTWSENCIVEYVDGVVAPVISATSTNYDGQAKVYFAVYAADTSLLDCVVYDYESGLVYGDEGYVEFVESNYEKPIDKVSVFILESGTIRPLITNKNILKSEFVD